MFWAICIQIFRTQIWNVYIPNVAESGHGSFLHRNSTKCPPDGCAWPSSFYDEMTPLCSYKLAPQIFPGKKKYCYISHVDVGKITRIWQKDRAEMSAVLRPLPQVTQAQRCNSATGSSRIIIVTQPTAVGCCW